MSTDRELLELAAKAAGIRLDSCGENGGWYWPDGKDGAAMPAPWNPLGVDGDALRLAATLRLQILPGKHHGDGCSVNPTHHSTPGVTSFVESKDMAEQMRRAITWAAAEIGRAMP